MSKNYTGFTTEKATFDNNSKLYQKEKIFSDGEAKTQSDMDSLREKLNRMTRKMTQNDIIKLRPDLIKMLRENPEYAEFMNEFCNTIKQMKQKDADDFLKAFSSISNSFVRSAKTNNKTTSKTFNASKSTNINVEQLAKSIEDLMIKNNEFAKAIQSTIQATKSSEIPHQGKQQMLNSIIKNCHPLIKIGAKLLVFAYNESRQR